MKHQSDYLVNRWGTAPVVAEAGQIKELYVHLSNRSGEILKVDDKTFRRWIGRGGEGGDESAMQAVWDSIDTLESRMSGIDKKQKDFEPFINNYSSLTAKVELLEKETDKVEPLKQSHEQLRQSTQTLLASHTDLESQVTQLAAQQAATQRQVEVNGAKLRTVETNTQNLNRLDGKVDQLSLKYTDLEGRIVLLEELTATHTTTLTQHGSRLDVLEQFRTNSLETQQKLTSDVSSIQTTLSTWDTLNSRLDTAELKIKATDTLIQSQVSILNQKSQELDTVKADQQRHKSQLDSLTSRVDDLETNGSTGTATLGKDHTSEIQALETKVTSLESGKQTTDSDIESLKQSIQGLQTVDNGHNQRITANTEALKAIPGYDNRINANAHNHSELASKHTELSNKVDTQKDAIDSHTEQLSQMTLELNNIRDAIPQPPDLSQIKQDIQTNQQLIDSNRQKTIANSNEIEQLKGKVQSNTSAIETLQSNVGGLSNLNAKISGLESKVNAVEPKVQQHDTSIGSLTIKSSQLEQSVQTVDAKVAGFDSRIQTLESGARIWNAVRGMAVENNTKVNQVATDITNLRTKTDLHDTQIGALQSTVSQHSSRIHALEQRPNGGGSGGSMSDHTSDINALKQKNTEYDTAFAKLNGYFTSDGQLTNPPVADVSFTMEGVVNGTYSTEGGQRKVTTEFPDGKVNANQVIVGPDTEAEGTCLRISNDTAGSIIFSLGTRDQLLSGGQRANPFYINKNSYITVFNYPINASAVNVGYSSGAANSVNCSNWFRASGNSGIMFATHQGGFYMSDTFYVRSLNYKGHLTGHIATAMNLQNCKLVGEVTTQFNNKRLKPVRITVMDQPEQRFGLLAEEVKTVVPELVVGEGRAAALDVLGLIAYLVDRVNKLEDRIATLGG